MTRIVQKAWNLLAVATIEVARLFPGVGRVRGRVNRKGGTEPERDLDITLRRFRRAVVALWMLNVLVAVTLVAAVGTAV